MSAKRANGMQGLLSVWSSLSLSKRITLVAAVLATIGAFSLLARTASNPSMKVLYAGLDGRSAGEVISALERLSIDFEVRGDAIYVPASHRDVARMTLAGEGLPQSGQAGYELLDQLNGFSTTSDMFDATFWRAKEGELARTILSTPGVSSARVHIAHESGGPFARSVAEPNAVVTVTMGRGQLAPSQAKAIQYLVGAAVPGMVPEKVAVLDSSRGVILSPGDESTNPAEHEDIGGRERKIEMDILNILEARVGAGNARVQVALDIDRERESISERVFDPDGRVISAREVNEVTESSSGSGGQSVTVASNLPEGDDEAGGARSNSNRTETREVISYDMSEVRREREKLPGSIRRLSIAVLVNEVVEQPEGADAVLREAGELDTLRELVAQAAGFDEARGDSLTIQALPFRPRNNEGVLVEANPFASFMGRNLMSIIQLSVLAIVTLILGLFVVKPVLASQPADGGSLPLDDELSFEPLGQLPTYDEAQLAQDDDIGAVDPIETLQGIASEKPEEATALLKDWLDSEAAETAA